jgi:hypothetical protein
VVERPEFKPQSWKKKKKKKNPRIELRQARNSGVQEGESQAPVV